MTLTILLLTAVGLFPPGATKPAGVLSAPASLLPTQLDLSYPLKHFG